jgi:hypothetical protein
MSQIGLIVGCVLGVLITVAISPSDVLPALVVIVCCVTIQVVTVKLRGQS